MIGLSTVGQGNGTDLSITVHVGQNLSKKIYEAHIWNKYSTVSKAVVQTSRFSRKISQVESKKYVSSEYSVDEDVLCIDMEDCPAMSEDVRVQFHCSSNKVLKGYESCAFYFWYVM